MADHIRIRTAPGTWVVRAGGAVLGESKRVQELTEGSYGPVHYFPRADIAMAMLDRTDRASTSYRSPPFNTVTYFGDTPFASVSRSCCHRTPRLCAGNVKGRGV